MILNQLLKNKELIELFHSSYNIYLESNTSLKEDYSKYSFSQDLNYKWEGENFLESFKNNFFSLLMASIILKVSKDKENSISYVKVLSCLRQIITSTDNIIDKEEKGLIFLKNIDNLVVKNTLINIATQEIMSSTLKGLKSDLNLNNEIIAKIYNIACGESLRDEKLYDGYPSSDYITQKIHRGIGGELLELSLITPKLVEGREIVEKYSKGLFKIGMSLQALDDLCDIQEDLSDNKVNLAVARLIEEEGIKKEDLSFNIINTSQSLEGHINTFIKRYLDETILTAVEGFMVLKENGYPITFLDIKLLLKHLFKVRGLEKFWKLVNID